MTPTFVRPEAYSKSEGERFNGDTNLTVVTCASCHVTYAIPTSFDRAAKEHNSAANPSNYWSVCCPFGHQWHYSGLNETQRLKKQRDLAREEAARERARRDQAEASARAQKGAATRARNERDRIRKRAKAGVCPCCNRTFKQLAAHMQTKHPEYDAAAAE